MDKPQEGLHAGRRRDRAELDDASFRGLDADFAFFHTRFAGGLTGRRGDRAGWAGCKDGLLRQRRRRQQGCECSANNEPTSERFAQRKHVNLQETKDDLAEAQVEAHPESSRWRLMKGSGRLWKVQNRNLRRVAMITISQEMCILSGHSTLYGNSNQKEEQKHCNPAFSLRKNYFRPEFQN